MAALGDFIGGITGGATVAIVIKAIDDYSKEFDKAGKKTRDFSKTLSTGMLAASAAMLAFSYSSVKSAAEGEKTAFKLKRVYGSMADAVIKASDEMQDASTTSNDAIAQGFIELQTRAKTLGLTFAQQKSVIGGALDYAAIKGEDFNEVLGLSISAMNGNAKAFKNLGITIDDNASKQEIYNALISKYGEYSGAAKASTKTLDGALASLGNAFDDLKKALALGLAPVITKVISGIKFFVDKFNSLDAGTKSAVGGAVVGGGLALGAAGLYAKLAGLSPLNPLFVKDVSGGLGGVAKGAKTGGTVAGLSALALPVAVAAGALIVGGTATELARRHPTTSPVGEDFNPLGNTPFAGFGMTADNVRAKMNPISNPDLSIPGYQGVMNKLLGTEKGALDVDKQALPVKQNLNDLVQQSINFEEAKISLFEQGLPMTEDMIKNYDVLNSKMANLSDYEREFVEYRIKSIKETAEMQKDLLASYGKGGKNERYAVNFNDKNSPTGESIGGVPLVSSKTKIGTDLGGGWKKAKDDYPNGKKVNDFIMRPSGELIQTNPNDTIVGVQNTGKLGTTIVIQGDNYGVNADAIAASLAVKLREAVTF